MQNNGPIPTERFLRVDIRPILLAVNWQSRSVLTLRQGVSEQERHQSGGLGRGQTLGIAHVETELSKSLSYHKHRWVYGLSVFALLVLRG